MKKKRNLQQDFFQTGFIYKKGNGILKDMAEIKKVENFSSQGEG